MSFTVKPGFAQSARGAAGGDQFDAEACEDLGQINQAGFVSHAEQRPADRLCRTVDALTVQLPGDLH